MSTIYDAIPDLSGQVLTVNGPVRPEALGVTSMHEHIFCDLVRPPHHARKGYDQPAARARLTLDILADVRSGAANIDNDQLGDFDEMLAEILPYRHAGGGTIVEVSSIGLGRDPKALQRMSAATGLHIVMGAGWYEPSFHPVDMDEMTVEQMTEIIVTDVVRGAEGTRIRSGIIGEVGVEGNPLTANEIKSVRASGRAAALTGAPITFHRGGVGEEQLRCLDVLEEEGADLSTVTMGHAGLLGLNMDFAHRLLARGVFVEFDFLGAPGSPWGTLWPFTDIKVGEGMAALVDAGYADRIVLGHDVCTKLQLKRYGGHGYTYLFDHFIPALHELGVPEAVTDTFMRQNAWRALTFARPKR